MPKFLVSSFQNSKYQIINKHFHERNVPCIHDNNENIHKEIAISDG
jgi:hypothetical protein